MATKELSNSGNYNYNFIQPGTAPEWNYGDTSYITPQEYQYQTVDPRLYNYQWDYGNFAAPTRPSTNDPALRGEATTLADTQLQSSLSAIARERALAEAQWFGDNSDLNYSHQQAMQQSQYRGNENMARAIAAMGGSGMRYGQSAAQNQFAMGNATSNELAGLQSEYIRNLQKLQQNQQAMSYGFNSQAIDAENQRLANYLTSLRSIMDSEAALYATDAQIYGTNVGANTARNQALLNSGDTRLGYAYDENANMYNNMNSYNQNTYNGQIDQRGQNMQQQTAANQANFGVWTTNQNNLFAQNQDFNQGRNEWVQGNLNRDFQASESALGRDFQASESALGRDFQAGESVLDRQHQTDQSALDRQQQTYLNNLNNQQQAKLAQFGYRGQVQLSKLGYNQQVGLTNLDYKNQAKLAKMGGGSGGGSGGGGSSSGGSGGGAQDTSKEGLKVGEYIPNTKVQYVGGGRYIMGQRREPYEPYTPSGVRSTTQTKAKMPNTALNQGTFNIPYKNATQARYGSVSPRSATNNKFKPAVK